MNKTCLGIKYKSLLYFLFLILLVVIFLRASNAQGFMPANRSSKGSSEGDNFISQESQTNLYLPAIYKVLPNTSFLGIMMPVYWSTENVDIYMIEADALAGKKHTAVEWGIDVQDPALFEPWATDNDLNKNNLYRQLEQLWLKGYVSFVKIGSSTTIREIADGQYDPQLT